jgi:hypothetical protein
MEPVKSPREQRDILRAIFEDDSFTKYLDNFEIKLEEINGAIQIAVRLIDARGGRPLLYLRTHTNRGGTPAAMIAKRGRDYFLLHDGRVRKHGFGNPFSEKEVVVDGRTLNVVGKIDKGLFNCILSFHASRTGPLTLLENPRPAFDPGPKNATNVLPFQKNLIARHHNMCVLLWSYAKKQGWHLTLRKSCSPDLAVERDGVCLLFEVKPSGDLSHISSAIGQLLIYDVEIQANERIIVAPISENLFDRCKSILDKYGIKWLDQDAEALMLSSNIRRMLK